LYNISLKCIFGDLKPDIIVFNRIKNNGYWRDV